jgi:hypothetical protein
MAIVVVGVVTTLDLGYNALAWTISSSLGDLTALTLLELPTNSLTGTIPSCQRVGQQTTDQRQLSQVLVTTGLPPRPGLTTIMMVSMRITKYNDPSISG